MRGRPPRGSKRLRFFGNFELNFFKIGALAFGFEMSALEVYEISVTNSNLNLLDSVIRNQ